MTIRSRMSSTLVALGIGYSWGSGLLTLGDKSTHKFLITNLKVGSLGVSSVRGAWNRPPPHRGDH